MRTAAAIVACSILPLLSGCAAPTRPSTAGSTGTQAGDSLYRRLGGERGINRLADDFAHRLASDRRFLSATGPLDASRFEAEMARRICAVSGGPCTLAEPPGRPMPGSREHRAEVAFRDDLMRSLQDNNVPLQDQIWLLSLLYPLGEAVAEVKN